MTSEELAEKYPKIFENAYPGVEKGWLWLIDELCKGLQFDTDQNGYPQVKALQVKEKFGGLRFYYTSIEPKDAKRDTVEHHYGVQSGMVRMIESLSYVICEFCGKPGAKIDSPRGWRKTLCSECGAKYKEGKAPWREGWDDKCTCCCHTDPFCHVHMVGSG